MSKESKGKLSNKLDMELFHIEQDVRDLEEEAIEKGDRELSEKLLAIADKIARLQND